MPHTSETFSVIRFFIIKKYGGICTRCGTKEKLEFHIIGNGSGKAQGGWQHLEEIINHLIDKDKSIDLVCEKCHGKIHRGEIK